MTDKELDRLADKIAKKIGDQHGVPVDTYGITIKILKSYNRMKRFIKMKEQEVTDLENGIIKERSCGIVKYDSHESRMFQSQIDTRQNQIDVINEIIASKKKRIIQIDLAIDEIKDEKYWEIIPKFYFEGFSIIDIAEQFDVDESTIKRARKKLIIDLSVSLFPDEKALSHVLNN